MNTFETPALKIVLVRPGETELDSQGRITGSLDLPLSPTGSAQVRQVCHDLKDFEIDAIYASGNQSTKQTAMALSRDGTIKVKQDENLSNLNYGLWHGKLIEELKETQPKLFKKWQDLPQTVHPPEGETIDVVQSRVEKVLKKIRRKYRTGVVVIVAPEPLASIIRCEIEGSSLEGHWHISGNFGGWDIVQCPQESIA